MTISSSELGDRAAIRDLFVIYCTALRDKDVDLLDGVFAPDAVIDYSRIGGPKSGLAEVKPWLAATLTGVRTFALYIGDSTYVFATDRRSAAVTTSWHGVFVPEEGPSLQVYGTYQDAVALSTSGRWAIVERIDQPLVQLTSAPPA